MRQIGKAKIVIARKNYGCDACEWITPMDDIAVFALELTFTERRAIVKARKNGWRILKGEPCLTYTLVSCDGKDIIRCRAIPEIDAINIKYDVYMDAEVC
jgi:hypothetical protein